MPSPGDQLTRIHRPRGRGAGGRTEVYGRWAGFRLRGSIDRVEPRPDGLIAIDYKTSSKAPLGVQNEAGKANIDLQLPIYLNVALAELYPDDPPASRRYYSLTKARI